MSEILSNIVVEQNSINFSPETNNINITPEAIQLNVFTGAAPGAGQSSNGELLYNNTNLIDGVPFTSYANGILTLGDPSNISITGGTNGYFLQTDGAGNLAWAAGGGGGNGSPGGSNTQIQYNDNGVFGGNVGFTFNEVSGNVAIPGSLAVASLISGTLSTAAQPNITSVGNLNGLTVTGSGITTTQIRTTSTKVALGLDAGLTGQGNNAVGVGGAAGYFNQGANTVAIGFQAGYDTQGQNSIAIGTFAGNFFQHSNTIVLNATGTALNTAASDRFYVNPIRNIVGNNFVFYNPSTSEITYDANIGTLPSLTVTGNVNAGNVNTANLSATGNTTLASTFVKPIQESVTVVGTAAGANYTYNLIDQAVVYNTANANANLTLNFVGNGTTTANSFISNANSVVATYLLTNGGTAYAITGVNIDGSSRTIMWAGNTVPTTYQNTIMSYTFNLIKTGSNTYTVMGSATRFG